MAALDTSPLESERVERLDSGLRSGGERPLSRAFATRWTAACLALLRELGEGEDVQTLERTAHVLVRHGARLATGVQCVITVVPPERPGFVSVLAGEGQWAASLTGEEWALDGTLNGRAMLTGTAVETTQAQSESGTAHVLAPGAIETGRIVPLRLQTSLPDGRLSMGAIGFWRAGHAAYTDDERSLMDTFGELATVLIHRAELLGAAARATKRFECAVDVAVATGASLVPTSVMRRLLERSLDIVRADRGSVCRIHGTTMTVLDVVDRERPVETTGERFEQPWHAAVHRAVEERRPVVIGPFDEDALDPSQHAAVRGSERTLFMPLMAEGDVIALLTLMRRSDEPFSDADVSTVQLIGNIASLSLRNAERYSESQRAHVRSLRALIEITRHVDDTYELGAFFARLTRTVAELVGAARAAFFEVGPDGASRLVRPGYNVDSDAAPKPGPSRLRRGSAPWRVAFEDETFNSADPRQIAVWLPGLKARSAMAVSWRAGDKVLGSLVAFDSVTGAGFTEEDVWVLRIAALAAGLVWQHKQVEARELQLVRETREHVHEMTVVQQAAAALSSALDADAVFRQVVQSAAHIVTPPTSTARRATLLRVEGSTATIIAEYDEAGQRTGQSEYDLDEHPQMRRVLDTGDVVVLDLSKGDVAPATARQMRSMGVRSSALAPIRVGEKIVAILRVSAREESGFGPAQEERLLAIANVAALAVGNAERYLFAQREALRRAELENIKSEFLRLASHELRGPIGLLRGYLSMFEDGTVPSVSGQARETLPILMAKIAQMSRMVDDMLETARLEEGRTQLNIQLADLRTLVLRAVETVRPLATSAHTIRLRVPDGPVQIAADTSSVETILTNLLDNAIKYSPAGGLIECSLTTSGGKASVAVRDHGLGIAEHDVPRLFSRFGRILTPDNSHIGGTGLGLHLARELARMQGGTIAVRSRPRQGSVFTLRLPISSAT